MHGSLYRYSRGLQAFESPASHCFSSFCIFVGGLTDGLLACSYVERLAEQCHKEGWALVQPVLSSSYAGFGTSSLDRDVDEIASLIEYLIGQRDAKQFALCGHSTGCQDAVHFLKNAPPALRARVRAAILQAPVSDREANREDVPSGPAWAAHGFSSPQQHAALLADAQSRVADGRGDEILSTRYFGFVPMTAARYAALSERGGKDDYFSSDFSDDELRERLGHLSTLGQRIGPAGEAEPVVDHPGLRTLFVLSAADEYVPRNVEPQGLARRFVVAAGGDGAADALIVPDANHNLSEPETAAEVFVLAAAALLASCK
uniref:AB hydrolase-1 domain-containing protein n=1 Tax=Coccolithus braarudii TaxID=221442 RepID=A0A7S0L6B9_9EUKA|mmetsp:Transcript_17588/g.37917  ORF Transcript_17588/g.37917 Transcript_17588/m.37917 type:complete len:317 (+) Transcript_17588:57-1007(+)